MMDHLTTEELEAMSGVEWHKRYRTAMALLADFQGLDPEEFKWVRDIFVERSAQPLE